MFLLINPNKSLNGGTFGRVGESIWTGLLSVNLASERVLFRYEGHLDMRNPPPLLSETFPSPQPPSFRQPVTFLFSYPASSLEFEASC